MHLLTVIHWDQNGHDVFSIWRNTVEYIEFSTLI